MSETKKPGSPTDLSASKRKRTQDEELEIDVNLPEPPSKKAKRREKKSSGKKQPSELALAAPNLVKAYFDSDLAQSKGPQVAQKKSEYGIWIGNLPFNATRDTLRDFFRNEGDIEGRDIVRLHLPTGAPSRHGSGSQNKGFAYVDFTTKAVLEKAITLSERMLSGRRVLIKDAKSFEGRPVKPADTTSNGKIGSKEPTKRVFVGNLGFDVTRDDLAEHFSRAGEVEDIFMATFEDTGKCKGFGWVRFSTIEAAQAAVQGYIYENIVEDDADGDEADEESQDEVEIVTETPSKTSSKKRKQKAFINKLYGRLLRCEFAEDAQTRYKKRFSKDARASRPQTTDEDAAGGINDDTDFQDLVDQAAAAGKNKSARRQGQSQEERRQERRKRHEKFDARNVAPGRALANAPRSSGAIVAGEGKKTTFEE